MTKRGIISLVALVTLIASTGLYYASKLISIGVAYKAKVLCSGVFVSKLNPESVLNSDLAVDDLAILRYIDAKIDRVTQTSAASFLGLMNQTAVFRPGLGCTLVFAGYEDRLSVPGDTIVPAFDPKHGVWPDDSAAVKAAANVDQSRLTAAQEWAFSEPDAKHLRRTRAVVIVHKGRIVGERYALGFDQNTPLIGWSMTKSVMHALVGVLVGEGKLSLTDRAHALEWREEEDGRRMITVANLLEMTTGLEFEEDYTDPLADVTYMLLRVPDMAHYGYCWRIRFWSESHLSGD